MTTTVARPVAAPTAGRSPRPDHQAPRTRHNGGLYAILLAGYPVSWALGLGLAHHLIMAAVMMMWLTAHRPLRIPPTTGLLGLFLVVVSFSAIGLDGAGAAALFVLRWSWYAAALIGWLYLGRHRGADGGRLLVWSMIGLWVLMVAGGWSSIVFPELAWTTPTAGVAPGALADNELIARFLYPETSETQVFRYEDVVLYRPAAPFPYTNGWGSAMALLTPFVLAALHDRRLGIPRPVIVALLVVGVVPFIEALNRGAWLTLGLGLVYGGLRWARLRRDVRPLLVLAVALLVGVSLAVATGAAQGALDSLATRTDDSNETRSGLYLETISETVESPLIGYGSTRPSVTNPTGPPLGTHGQLWAVLFAHGFLGAALYVGFFVTALLRARSVDPVQHWAKVSLAIGVVQLPIYGHLPHQLFIMVGAAAIACWPSVPTPRRPAGEAPRALGASPQPL